MKRNHFEKKQFIISYVQVSIYYAHQRCWYFRPAQMKLDIFH